LLLGTGKVGEAVKILLDVDRVLTTDKFRRLEDACYAARQQGTDPITNIPAPHCLPNSDDFTGHF